jgi:putative transposase
LRYGLKTNFISYNPVWFHIVDGEFQREFLERVCDPDDPARSGSAELHLHDDGTLFCHLMVSWPVETYVPGDVSTAVGVDLNDDPLVAAAVVEEGGNVEAVDMVRRREYRHHRERLKRRRKGAQEAGNLAAVKSTRLTYNRYTDHMTNERGESVRGRSRRCACAGCDPIRGFDPLS